MSALITKLTSRKLWMAIAGVATGIFIALGGTASEVTTVAGAVTALVSAATYIITEGKVDAASVSAAVTATQEAVSTIADGTTATDVTSTT